MTLSWCFKIKQIPVGFPLEVVEIQNLNEYQRHRVDVIKVSGDRASYRGFKVKRQVGVTCPRENGTQIKV